MISSVHIIGGFIALTLFSIFFIMTRKLVRIRNSFRSHYNELSMSIQRINELLIAKHGDIEKTLNTFSKSHTNLHEKIDKLSFTMKKIDEELDKNIRIAGILRHNAFLDHVTALLSNARNNKLIDKSTYLDLMQELTDFKTDNFSR